MTTLEQLRELEAKATKGPWSSHVEVPGLAPAHITRVYIGEGGLRHKDFLADLLSATQPNDANAALIAAMRNALPKLLAVASFVEDYWVHVGCGAPVYETCRDSDGGGDPDNPCLGCRSRDLISALQECAGGSE